MLDEIKTTLENEFNLPVYYGSSLEASGRKIYDYIVFWRDHTDFGPGTRGDRVEYYTVTLVRKDFIPEGDAERMAQVVSEIKGLKRDGNVQYDYLEAPNTALALETAACSFKHALREC